MGLNLQISIHNCKCIVDSYSQHSSPHSSFLKNDSMELYHSKRDHQGLSTTETQYSLQLRKPLNSRLPEARRAHQSCQFYLFPHSFPHSGMERPVLWAGRTVLTLFLTSLDEGQDFEWCPQNPKSVIQRWQSRDDSNSFCKSRSWWVLWAKKIEKYTIDNEL